MAMYVRLTRYVDRCGIAVDSKKNGSAWRYYVQLGADGPFEWHAEKDCEIITEQQFWDYMNKGP